MWCGTRPRRSNSKNRGVQRFEARSVVTDGQLAAIRAVLETQRSIDRTYLVGAERLFGNRLVTMEKLIYIRKR